MKQKKTIKILKKCPICKNSFIRSPQKILSFLETIPEGLDRSRYVEALIWKCYSCGSYTCSQTQNQKEYADALCFEASKKTLDNSLSEYPYSSDLLPEIAKSKIDNHIILDFGCGAGFFTRELNKFSKKAIGVDLDPSGLKGLLDSKIDAFEGDIEFAQKLKFQSLSLVGVLEHFQNPFQELKKLINSMNYKDSAILIYYPNTKSLTRYISKLSSHSWDMFLEPGHLVFPSRKSLLFFMKENQYKCLKYWTTSNISRGKIPFLPNRDPKKESFIRNIINSSWVARKIYFSMFRIIDLLKLGDIDCYLFYR